MSSMAMVICLVKMVERTISSRGNPSPLQEEVQRVIVIMILIQWRMIKAIYMIGESQCPLKALGINIAQLCAHRHGIDLMMNIILEGVDQGHMMLLRKDLVPKV